MAIGLKRAGHEVTLATHENFEAFVRTVHRLKLRYDLAHGQRC
ncbi:hypothetical protein [Nostoc sphaeroides]|nr:hypothetical protein [Nostoc sphaeroides]